MWGVLLRVQRDHAGQKTMTFEGRPHQEACAWSHIFEEEQAACVSAREGGAFMCRRRLLNHPTNLWVHLFLDAGIALEQADSVPPRSVTMRLVREEQLFRRAC